MAFIQSLALFFVAINFAFGQLFRLSLFGVSLPLIDIAIVILALINFFANRKQRIINNAFFLFIIFAWTDLIFNLIYHHLNFIKPTFYLIRLTSLLSFFIWPPIVNKKFQYLLNLSIIANIIFGYIQYFIWPNFTYFSALNWDPHLNRLISTFFDPTFTSLLYLFFLIKIFLTPFSNQKLKYLSLLLVYLAFALTYSRSGYLCFLAAFLFLATKLRQLKIFVFSCFILLTTILLLPHPPGEGTKLDRYASIRAKIINYQQGLSLFAKFPITGIGYNTLESFKHIDNNQSHANNGFDSSLLTILVTTGPLGLILFCSGLRSYWLKNNLFSQTLLLITLIHSLFANSLLYPWVLLYLGLVNFKYRKLS